MYAQELRQEALRRGFPAAGVLLLCHATTQRMTVLDGSAESSYRISTSALGLGQVNGSYQTPAGWHEIVERIGGGCPLGTVFRGRVPTGEVLPASAWDTGPGDAITTRILWLSGLEEGLNRGGAVDTHARYIYVHGTNHEAQLGQAASHGCIRMGNADMAELFDRVGARPAWCWIGA